MRTIFMFLSLALFAACLTLTTASLARKATFERTVIFLRASTSIGQNVFIRGGVSGTQQQCTEPAATDACAIPIQHRIRPTDTSSSYYQWSEGDHFLDWHGAELLQGSHDGKAAGGTPLTWTTDVPSSTRVETSGFGYSDLNRFGEHYWMVDVDMDCSKTENGWFEFKGYVTPLLGWESDISQYSQCAGTLLNTPYVTNNHLGRCGEMNLYYWQEGECNFYRIPLNPSIPALGSCGHRQVWDDAGQSADYIDPAIVNGNPVNLGHWPWQGVLQYNDVIGGCAGVLIDTRWALTAAHCVQGTNPAILKIRFGEQNLMVTQGNEQAKQVLRIIIHYKYQNGDPGDPYNDYDLALLELVTSVDLSSHVVNTACLPSGYGIDSFVNTDCWASGFGDTKGGSEKYRLQAINVPVWSYDDCVNDLGSDRVTVRQVCMGTNSLSACGGDSGGPLVCFKDGRWVLVGVTSWGTSTCSNGPSVYSRVTEYLPWITAETGLTF